MKTYFLKYFHSSFERLKALSVCLSLASLLLGAIGPVYAKETGGASPPVVESISLAQLDERTFYKMVDERTEEVLKKLGPALSAEEAKGLAKAKEKTLQVLKTLNLWEHLKGLFYKHGVGIAVANLIGEVMFSFVLPPVLSSMGHELLAAIVFGSPNYLVVTAGYVKGANFVDKVRVAREMDLGFFGFSTVNELDNLRRDLMGFSNQYKVMDVVMKTLDQDHEISIVRDTFFHKSKNFKGQAVALGEMEKLVKAKLGARKFKILKEFGHGNEAIYANLLVQEIDRDSAMRSAFFDIVHARMSSFPLAHENHRAFMSATDEERKVISLYQEKLRAFKGEANAELKKAGFSTPENKKIIDDFVKAKLSELASLDREIKMFEYRYLNSIRLGTPFEQESFNAQIMKEKMENIQKRIEGNLFHFPIPGKEELTHQLGQLKTHNENPLALPPSSFCEGAKEFFKKIGRP